MRAAFLIILLLALAGCGSRTDKQLAAVKSARSVLSEWALVEQQAAAGRAPSTYVEQMREMAKDQLKTASKALSGQHETAHLIDGLRESEPGATLLQHAASILEPLEKRLEAA